MIGLNEVTGICKDAQFVFNTGSSFALYLEFKIPETESAVCFYLSDYASIMQITKILNKDQTGFTKDLLDNCDLKELIGMKAKIYSAGIGTKCFFSRFIDDLEVVKN